jgi:mannose-6-phosphate isomerase-like protein (cupin superfamily)
VAENDMLKIASLTVLALGLATSGFAAPATGPALDEGHYVSAGHLAHMTGKTKEGLAIAPVPTGPGATMLEAKRDRPGLVELHAHQNDEFVVQSGHAIVRVGGKVTGNHQTGPGEWRGGTIEGGHAYQMAPGDVLWIPAGSPHQVTPKGGVFRYLAIKFDAR